MIKILPFATTYMDLKSIILDKICQTKKIPHYLSYTGGAKVGLQSWVYESRVHFSITIY